MNVNVDVRDLLARRAAIARYATAHDVFSEVEQKAVYEGRMADAQTAHEYALWTLRACRAEMDDPVPE